MSGKPGKYALAVSLFGIIFLSASYAAAHCELPCGIYNDQMRIEMIDEDITTIEKAMKQITELGSQKKINYNQLVRWITNKEYHADKIQEVVYQYFMTQRIKPDTDKYEEKLVLLHKMLVAAMKCKQTTDLSHVETLRSLLKSFETLYFGHAHK
ncbi:MAG: superoxide dismutase [Ni] [Deltaproteobacteria bacterium]|jgi:nickel superoxide dismutase